MRNEETEREAFLQDMDGIITFQGDNNRLKLNVM